MLFFASGVDEQVVEVDEDVRMVTENHVHGPLEGGTCVSEAHGHVQVLERAERRGDGGFWDVGWVHRHLMIRPEQVDF